MDRLLTIHEAADRLAVCVDTVRRLVRKQQIPVVRFGGRYGAMRFLPADLESYIAQRRQPAKASLPKADPVTPSVLSRMPGAQRYRVG